MTSPWEHPPLHANCIPCATRRETELRKRVEALDAALSSIASRCADGVVTLAQIESDARAALAGEGTP